MDDKTQGQAPAPGAAGQAPAAQTTTSSQQEQGEPRESNDEIKALRKEAAKYRTERNEALRLIEEQKKAQEAAEALKLEEQGKYKELADARAAKVKEASDALLRQGVTNALLSKGYTAAQAATLSRDADRFDIRVNDTFEIEGDLDGFLTACSEVFPPTIAKPVQEQKTEAKPAVEVKQVANGSADAPITGFNKGAFKDWAKRQGRLS